MHIQQRMLSPTVVEYNYSLGEEFHIIHDALLQKDTTVY
ncbi:unnamed protein product, partial [Rotaria sp. Silwood2]